MDVEHVVVLMLENRSFDSLLGTLYPPSAGFDGLTGNEQNPWTAPDGSVQDPIRVWKSPQMTPDAACIPNPDPGELFTDMHMQIHGLSGAGPAMSGFVDNYVRQPPANGAHDPASVMHYFTDSELPALSALAKAFGVSDRWHASAPCQTWPNRFFAHTGTANGYVNNTPTHFPYLMETVFNRLKEDAKVAWRVYFHDIPQTLTLSRLWPDVAANFRFVDDDFIRDAAAGNLPAYSFIEPRYFADPTLMKMPNDMHPPHNVQYGDALVATVYNAVRAGPNWKKTLLIITFDEHGGCYDHVPPPAATPPGGPLRPPPDNYDFSAFGVRVPAVIVSPFVPAASVIRPPGPTPFDHTSIIATLRTLFPFAPLTPRDAAAPNLITAIGALGGHGDNDGPAFLPVTEPTPSGTEMAAAAGARPNDLQQALSTAALLLPTAGANAAVHVQRLAAVPDTQASHPTVEAAIADVLVHVKAFLGRL